MKGWLIYAMVSLGIPLLWVVWVYARDMWKDAQRRRQDHERRIARILEQIAQRHKEEGDLWENQK